MPHHAPPCTQLQFLQSPHDTIIKGEPLASIAVAHQKLRHHFAAVGQRNAVPDPIYSEVDESFPSQVDDAWHAFIASHIYGEVGSADMECTAATFTFEKD